MSAKPIVAYQLLQNCGHLPSSLFTKLAEQERLKKIILSSLPSFLHTHYLGCTKNDKTLIIFMDSAAGSSPTRFHSTEILTRLRTTGITNFDSLTIKTHYDPQRISTGNEKTDKTKIPSGKTISLIRKNSQSITDPQLASSLLRLASTLEQRIQITFPDNR